MTCFYPIFHPLISVREYVVSTMTGDGFGSGTDAQVFINLIGTLGDSGKRFLIHNLEGTDEKFESGQVGISSLGAPLIVHLLTVVQYLHVQILPHPHTFASHCQGL